MVETAAKRKRKLKAPFPSFGGKSRIAPLVWERLSRASDPARNFIEPFCFSAAMLLLRPDEPAIETVNDLNCFVANFWRAVQHDPEAVARHADWPVNETDLHARHAWLVRSHEAAEKLEQVRKDPDFWDARIAGWWCWGACMWIGSGWCEQQLPHDEQTPGKVWEGRGTALQNPRHRYAAEAGNYEPPQEKRPQFNWGNSIKGNGVHKHAEDPSEPELQSAAGDAAELQGSRGVLSQQIPELQGEAGRAELCEKRPCIADHAFGRGVTAKTPDLSQQIPEIDRRGDAANPDANNRPQLADAYSRGRGVHGSDQYSDCERRRLWLINWFTLLADRFRAVRVCCGHWMRVCDSDSTLTRLGTTAVFLDPPYRKRLADGTVNRSEHIYANDKAQDVDALCDEVQAWCLKYGDDRAIRIALCGLEGEYPLLDAAGWEKVPWKSQGGYGNRNKDNKNAARERVWFSPHCLKPEQRRLFA